MICISYFMVILDNSIIFTGLPRIEAAMGFSPTGLTGVQDTYTLVFGGLLLLCVRGGDILGRRRMFIVGLVLFGAASFLVGISPFGWWLIGARARPGRGRGKPRRGRVDRLPRRGPPAGLAPGPP